MGGTSFLFGTVTASHNMDSIQDLRCHFEQTPSMEWIRGAVSELPDYWDLLVKTLPSIDGSFPGRQVLDDFDRWLRQGFNPDEKSIQLGNIILLPLVVMVGLTEYMQYVESSKPRCEDPLQEFISQLRADEASDAESIGLCAGLLTGYAVASSHTGLEFEKYGAAAIRLAMMIGAATDAQDAWHGKAKSYVAAWRNVEQGEQMKRAINLVYPQAYISVWLDERRVTITTTAQWIRSSILRQFQGAGLTVVESNIQGPIHCPNSESKDIADAICELCERTPALQLGDVSNLALRTYTNDGHGLPVDKPCLHELAVRSSLTTQCNWYGTFAALPLAHANSTQAVISFGPDRCVPQSLVASLSGRLTHVSDLSRVSAVSDSFAVSSAPAVPASIPSSAASVCNPSEQQTEKLDNTFTSHQPPRESEKTPQESPEEPHQHNETPRSAENTIAIVGMSIKTAGADDVDEFSRMIQSGLSQHELVGPDRLKFHTLWREGDWDPSYKWYANWIRNIDSYDHQFFKRSPREAANMDPAQRLSMEVAFQAVEKSGYYTRDENVATERSENQADPNHVGVYVGVTVDDYQNHVRSHRANAFSITGTMRSLIAGKISHHFGWTGPAMTLDTACSSSAVAIHTACRDLLAGDCNAALAGGANVISDPLAFQDLAAAGFLSPTGQCKPFDDSADGYCRGEAVGFVFLKRLSDALADGNQILGCISGSAVYQNENHTPIFVPNSPSLSNLFKHVMKKSQVQPSDISVVECHGTGTPVGDPAEWESVRHALEGPQRTDPVYVGSAKGHLGHTEAASGVVALIKVLTMMQCGYIPPQASHSRLSHLIEPTDMMRVASSQQPWRSTCKTALLNNYGASGCNVAMIVTESPLPQSQAGKITGDKTINLPFCITGRTVGSVKANCARLLSYLGVHSDVSLVDLSFNINRQSSRSLRYKFAFACSSLNDLKIALSQCLTSSSAPGEDLKFTASQPDRQIILCFGGQVSTAIGLDRSLYDRSRILRYYLDKCDMTIQSFGLKSIFPDIFSQQDVQDQQHLQTMLFAMQYSCAMSWMQSGLSSRVAAVIGHSFGELTAMSISGVLSLRDTVKLVAGRAALIRDLWGSDPGLMLAVEADESTVQTLLSEANRTYSGSHPASIACYNGPRSFTVAGSKEPIGVLTDLLSRTAPPIRSKRLRVTNAFHSSLVDPLAQQLGVLGESITFQKPRIPLERTTEIRSSLELLGPQYVAEQMRHPVFFHHAVERLAHDHPTCVWLEAGSHSTVTAMAQRALGSAPRASHHFQGVKINGPDAFNNLSEATVSLWKEGMPLSFWPHNAIQTTDYATLVLPPYQFEKEKHWVELRSPVELIEQIKEAVRSESSIQTVDPIENTNLKWVFTGYKDPNINGKRQPCFNINTASEEYQSLVTSHLLANTAGICSGMLQVDLAIGALSSLHPEWVTEGTYATLHETTNHAPICLDPSRVLSIEFENQENGFWDWRIIGSSVGAPCILHTTGRLRLRDPKDIAHQTEFRRLGRLIDHERCLALLNTGPRDDDVEVLQGRSIYRAFSEIVDFGEQYRSLRCLVGRGNESAGRLSRTQQNDAWFDQLRGEHISQVGGIWVNCMTDHSPSDIFLGAEIETWMVSPDWANRSLPDQCDVLARHLHHKDTGDYTSDSFVFDPVSGDLIEVLLGVRFTRTPRASFIRALQRLTSDQPTGSIEPSPSKTIQPVPTRTEASQGVIDLPKATTMPMVDETPTRDLLTDMTEVVANLVGVDVAEIGPDANLADFGVDSLLGLELQAEIKTAFSCEPNEVEILEATTIRALVACLPIAADMRPQETVDSVAQIPPPGESSLEIGSVSQASDPYWCTQSEYSTSSSFVLPDLLWSPSDVLKSFAATKSRGDQMIAEHNLENFDSDIIPDTNRLCTALVVECFEELGCPLRSAKPGEVLSRIPFEPQHKIFMNYIYQFLEKTAALIIVEENGQLIRTATPAPTMSSKDILPGLLDKYPDHGDFTQLTYHAGVHLARALSGLTDGNRVLMSHPEGRRLCQSVYHNYPLNRIGFETMRDVIDQVSKRIRTEKGPLHILELGGGTGSATSTLLPLLASLNIPVEYTFTDLSSSLVAQARRTFGKQYPFMKFAVQDIEKPPPKEIAGQQHIVLASNAVHATRSLEISTRNIRQALRPDGFLMVLEMREAWPALDLTFGLYEGWWLFEDERTHVYTSPETWKRSLTAAGYEAVDWTDGTLPEHKYYMVVIALASGLENK
jgi:acyl transferase domain-containing protein/SAM-dependent methyltransferase/acyl carrier protein